ncbi:hypothetical protein V8B97DRAFT_1355794 [Scleroderma yunnanense]
MAKRKLDEDWDFLDLTGNTPVYYKLEHQSQSSSHLRTAGTSASYMGSRQYDTTRTASLISSESLDAPKGSSRITHSEQLGGRPSALTPYQGATPILTSADMTPNYAVYSSTYTSPSAYDYCASSGSSQVVLSPPAKKARKGKGKSADGTQTLEKPEKRGAIMKKKCPQSILERVDRVMSQRFFMINRRREPNKLREEFSVLGSTGNVYTVMIDKIPSCNCPDASKGNHCKHILFIFLKVLQVPQTSHVWYQKALLTSELADIFAAAPPAPNSVASQRVREAYARATEKTASQCSAETMSSNEQSSSAKGPRRQPTQEDDCPICYECMHGAADTTLVWCETCGNAVHKQCFAEWAKSSPHNLTCVFCRSSWIDPSVSKGKGKAYAGNTGARARSSEGYLNLAAVAGLSGYRDTSTYYQGPRHG